MGHIYSETQVKSSGDAAVKEGATTDTGQSETSLRSTTALKHGPSARAWRRAHERMKADNGLWISLPFDGIQHDGIGGLLESRRCPCCGSTLSRRTTALHAVQVVATLSGIHSRSLDAIVD